MVYFVIQNVKTDGDWNIDCRDFALEIDTTREDFERFLESDELQSEYDFRTGDYFSCPGNSKSMFRDSPLLA
jgi:hypothetical protein